MVIKGISVQLVLGEQRVPREIKEIKVLKEREEFKDP